MANRRNCHQSHLTHAGPRVYHGIISRCVFWLKWTPVSVDILHDYPRGTVDRQSQQQARTNCVLRFFPHTFYGGPIGLLHSCFDGRSFSTLSRQTVRCYFMFPKHFFIVDDFLLDIERFWEHVLALLMVIQAYSAGVVTLRSACLCLRTGNVAWLLRTAYPGYSITCVLFTPISLRTFLLHLCIVRLHCWLSFLLEKERTFAWLSYFCFVMNQHKSGHLVFNLFLLPLSGVKHCEDGGILVCMLVCFSSCSSPVLLVPDVRCLLAISFLMILIRRWTWRPTKHCASLSLFSGVRRLPTLVP